MEDFVVTVNGIPYTVKATDITEAQAKARTMAGLQPKVTLPGLGKAAATGVRSGAEGLAAAPGDLPGVVGGAAGLAEKKLLGGTEEEAAETAGRFTEAARAASSPIAGIAMALERLGVISPQTEQAIRPPTSADVRSFTDRNVTAASPRLQEITRHTPQNEAERAVQTGGEFAVGGFSPFKPGIVRKLATNVVAPTIGTEVGGRLGERYLGDETMGRLLGGFMGATGPAAAGAPLAANAERTQLARVLTDAGIPLTAGQVSGRKGLQYLETGPFEGKPASIAEEQGRAFNRAALQRAGIDADLASPAVIEQARDTLGQQYDNLIAQSNGVPMDQGLEDALLDVGSSYERLSGSTGPAVRGYFDRIVAAASQNGGTIPPEVFSQIRSDIAGDVRKLTMAGQAGDPLLRDALVDFQEAMFDSMSRTGQPDLVDAWRETNRRWRNLKIIERSMGGAGEQTMQGYITPSKLRSAVERVSPNDWVAGRGDFAELARAGEGIMKPLPQTGSGARALVGGGATLFGLPELMQGDIKGGLTKLAAGVGAPVLASGALTSRPVRTTLVRQAIDPLPIIDPMVMALLSRQGELEDGRR